MIGIIVMFASMIMAFWTWSVPMRSYVMRSGESPFTPGAWGYWHFCREYAKKHNDPRGLRLARSFVFWQVAAVIGLLLGLCGI